MTNEQALENCRLFAARHRAEDWAKTILRFCNEGGATGSPLRAALASQVVQEPVAYRFTHNRGNGRTAYTYHDNTPENNWRTAYRDTCLSIEPLYATSVAAGEPHTEVVPASSVQRLMGDLQKRSDECEGVLIHIHRDELRKLLAVASGVLTGAPGATDVERAAWLADKIGALGDYAKEAAAMLRRWPSGVALPRALNDKPVTGA